LSPSLPTTSKCTTGWPILGSFLDDLGCLDRGLCRNSSLAYHAADAGLVADRQARRRAAARTAPRRADRLLLPDARLPVRGRGRRPGNPRPRVAEPRQLRGPRLAALVALPDRDQRLPRHAGRPRATRPADGSRARARAGRVEPQLAARGHLDRAD